MLVYLFSTPQSQPPTPALESKFSLEQGNSACFTDISLKYRVSPDTQQLKSYSNGCAGGHWHPYSLSLPTFFFYYSQLSFFHVHWNFCLSSPLRPYLFPLHFQFKSIFLLFPSPSIHPNYTFVDCLYDQRNVLCAKATVINKIDKIPTLVSRHCLFKETRLLFVFLAFLIVAYDFILFECDICSGGGKKTLCGPIGCDPNFV